MMKYSYGLVAVGFVSETLFGVGSWVCMAGLGGLVVGPMATQWWQNHRRESSA